MIREPASRGLTAAEGGVREEKQVKKRRGVVLGFGCQLIFKQQAGGVLVTDKEAALSSHSLTSSHSHLLSGRHRESGKQLRAACGFSERLSLSLPLNQNQIYWPSLFAPNKELSPVCGT